MAYTTPKTNWIAGDQVINSDMNRIEGNTKQNHEDFHFTLLNSKPIGYNIAANTGLGSYVFTVGPGQTVSKVNEQVINNPSTITKVFSSSSWAPGSGITSESRAPGVSFSNSTWYHVFILKNPTTNAYDVAIDDQRDGSKIIASTIYSTFGYTLLRRIGSLKSTGLNTPDMFVPTYSNNGVFYLGGNIAPRKAFFQNLGSGVVQTMVLKDIAFDNLVPPELECEMYLRVYNSASQSGYAWPLNVGLVGSATQIGRLITANNYELTIVSGTGGQIYFYYTGTLSDWTFEINSYVDPFFPD